MTQQAETDVAQTAAERLLNFALYQVGWLGCVLGSAWGRPWLGCGIAIATLLMHLCLARDWRLQLKCGAAAAAIGLAVDSTLLNGRAISFDAGMYVAWLPPLWMTLLWIQFATTFRYSLSWMRQRYLFAFIFGAFGAPPAFWFGERLGAIRFLDPRVTAFAFLGLCWCIAMPLLLLSIEQLSKRARPARYRWFSATKQESPAEFKEGD